MQNSTPQAPFERTNQGIGLLITVDEVRPNLDEMIQLAAVFQHFVREDRNVALLMAGLPSHISSLVSNESVSYLRRARMRRLGRISNQDIQDALVKTIESAGRTIEYEALDAEVSAIDGFPYLMQLIGYRLWAIRPNREPITVQDADQAIPLAREDYFTSVLDSTYRELSDGDLAFLCAMLPDQSPSAISDIAERMGKTPSYARVYRKRLLEQGIIAEERRGYVTFELPYFRDFLENR